jgi:hypothetical protein
LLEGDLGVAGNLRRHRGERAERERNRKRAERNGATGQGRQSEAA